MVEIVMYTQINLMNFAGMALEDEQTEQLACSNILAVTPYQLGK